MVQGGYFSPKGVIVDQNIRYHSANRGQLDRRHRPKRSSASAVTNETTLLPDFGRRRDGRSAWGRRVRDLIVQLTIDCGGRDNVSIAEQGLIRRAAVLMAELERRETCFCRSVEIDDSALSVYGSSTNTLRRTLEAIGLKRRAKDLKPTTLSDYLKASARPDSAEPIIIDNEEAG
jgi:hypothetical protein